MDNSQSSEHNKSTDTTPKQLEQTLNCQREAFHSEGFPDAKTRVNRITRVINLLVDQADSIVDSVIEDCGTRSKRQTLYSEIVFSLLPLKEARKNVKKWMRPSKRKCSFPFNLVRAKSWIQYQPKGVVGVIGPWNFPVHLALTPLAGILAAGNRCIIKPSEHTPRTTELLAELIGNAFDVSEVAVVKGGPEVGHQFCNLPLDHLLFTGGTNTGRKVMETAAANLVPVTLELGGRNPVVIGTSADLGKAATCCIGGKTFNAGQVCMSPNYALVHTSQLTEFVETIKAKAARMIPDYADDEDYGSPFGKRNFERLQSFLADARERGGQVIEINPSAESLNEPAHKKMPLHLILNTTDEMLVMNEEIFGPILPIKTYHRVEEAIQVVNDGPTPLCLYYFGKSVEEEMMVLQNTNSGGVTINEMFWYYAQDDLPFGGFGESGIGSYHGIHGFREFSNSKAVFRYPGIDIMGLSNLSLYPPYGKKFDNALRKLIKR